MAADAFLTQAATYLAATVISVPVAARLGLGSVLGYLVAGVIIGPAGLALVSGGADVLHVAEFGVVMMLFLVGLELQPRKLWQMRGAVFGLGGAQVGATAVMVAAAAAALGQPLPAAVAIGLILAMSSTAIVLQALAEKGQMKTPAGEASFAVLLFQDIAVIPILALLPLLAPAGAIDAGAGHGGGSLMDRLPNWADALVVLATVAAIIGAGRLVMRPVFRLMAATRMREVFTATALFLVAGIAVLMQWIGLSSALGAFVAGVVLADSEFRHEIEADIQPFKGLLLGLFFITVGAGLSVADILATPLVFAALVAAVVFGKALILWAILRFAGLAGPDRMLSALALSQIGEFAFVLIGFAAGIRILDAGTAGLLTGAVALSMLTTPLLLIALDRLSAPSADTGDAREPDRVDVRHRVIIAGFGRVGQIVGRVLIGHGYEVTVLDHDADQIEAVRRFGFKIHYGDAGRHDLLHAAGAEEAALLIVATDDAETTTGIVETARRNFPHLRVLARAYDRRHAYELEEAGAHAVVRETFAGSVEMGVAALRDLGLPAFEAERVGRIFRRHDAASFAALRELRKAGDQKSYGLAFSQRNAMLSAVIARDLGNGAGKEAPGWDSEPLRREFGDREGA